MVQLHDRESSRTACLSVSKVMLSVKTMLCSTEGWGLAPATYTRVNMPQSQTSPEVSVGYCRVTSVVYRSKYAIQRYGATSSLCCQY